MIFFSQSEYLQQKEFEEEEERLRQLEEKQQQHNKSDNQEQEEQQYSTIKRSPHYKSIEQEITTPTTPPSSTLSPTAVAAAPTTSILKNYSKNQLIDDLINRKNDNESNNGNKTCQIELVQFYCFLIILILNLIQVQVDDTYQEFLTEDMGLKARALYDYQAGKTLKVYYTTSE